MAGRAGLGRPKGSINKSTAEIKAAAAKHGPAAIKRLVHLMSKADSAATQVAAIKELLDRGYGKAAQPIGQAEDLQPIFQRVFFGDAPTS